MRGTPPTIARSVSGLSSRPRSAMIARRNGGCATARERFSIDATVRATAGSSGQVLASGDGIRDFESRNTGLASPALTIGVFRNR